MTPPKPNPRIDTTGWKVRHLSDQQLRFVAAYHGGSPADAAEKAGYIGKSHHDFAVRGERLLQNPRIVAKLEEQVRELREHYGDNAELIADTRDALVVATTIMNDGAASNRDRLRALEIILKCNGQMGQNIHVTVDVTLRGALLHVSTEVPGAKECVTKYLENQMKGIKSDENTEKALQVLPETSEALGKEVRLD